MLALALAVFPCAAQSLDDAVEKARQQAESGNPSAARGTLRDALRNDAFRAGVLARQQELSQLMATWAFAEVVPNPGPATLFQGELKSWKKRSLELRLIWDWTAMDEEARRIDFLRSGKDWLFAVPVEADLKLTISGEWQNTDPIALVLGVNRVKNSGWRFIPGFKRKKIEPVLTLPMQGRRFGEPWEPLASSTDGLVEPKGSWTYTLEVRKGVITLKRGNKKIGKWETRYPKELPGFVGFSAAGLQKVELKALLQGKAWEKRRQTRIEEERLRFRREEYDPLEDLPSWYLDLKEVGRAAERFRPPPDAPEALVGAWPELKSQDPSFLLEEWCNLHQAPPAMLEYARAVAKAYLGDWRAAAQHARAARQRGLDFGPVHAIEAIATFQTVGRAGILERGAKKMHLWPNDLGWMLATLGGRRGGIRATKVALEAAVAAGGLSEDITSTLEFIRQAEKGPAGQDSGRFQGTSVTVLSEGNNDQARAVGRAAVALISQMAQDFPGLHAAKEPAHILHFLDETGRRVFLKKVGFVDEERHYIPAARTILYVGNADEDSLGEVLFSSMVAFHLHTSFDWDTLPLWLRVGLGGWYEGGQVVNGGYVVGRNDALIQRSGENESGLFFRPDLLMTLPKEELLKNEYWTTCESYLLVDFLFELKVDPYRTAFRDYLGALKAGAPSNEAFAHALGHVDPKEFQDQFAQYRLDRLAGG